MNRRGFLRTGILAGLALASLPAAAATRFWPTLAAARAEVETQRERARLTEREVIELTLNYAESYQPALPGVDIRRALLDHLLMERGSSEPLERPPSA